ncbi:MAG: polyphosphate kinase 1 [Pseudomonadota bacterium]|nr:polyphosphate kinase 1 [Pseudomonadota bacterium]
MDTANLNLPDNFISRELSLLEFNKRVLAMANDQDVPILERLKFLCIVSSNLDEFFEIRLSSLKEKLIFRANNVGYEMLSTEKNLIKINKSAHELVNNQYELFSHNISTELHNVGINFLPAAQWNNKQYRWLRDFFYREIEPVLSPIALDSTRPFPRILNKSLNFIISLNGVDAFNRKTNIAIIQIPKSLPWLIQLKNEPENENDYVFLYEIIRQFVIQLFNGMEIKGCYQFRITRNIDYFLNEEKLSNLMFAMQDNLAANRFGKAVRLEVEDDCPMVLKKYLLQKFHLGNQDLYQARELVGLSCLMEIYNTTDKKELKYPEFTPSVPNTILKKSNIFESIANKDLLLNHPYQSFSPIIDMVSQGSNDPNTLSIKMTLYRLGDGYPIINHLVKAAKAGKEVTVLVELRARFDELANIKFANQLQEAGAQVIYGVVSFKTHSKMLLIVRRECNELKRYAHLGTGNYHLETARTYTDYSLLSADKNLTEDLHHIFLQLTGMKNTPPLKKLIQAPFGLHEHLLDCIHQEISNVNKGKKGHIVAKLNALVEPEIIKALYQASSAGVLIDLIIRGECCLKPGLPGISENIRVRSIIGRFLEHSRIYYFYDDGGEKIYCSSADWMERNMFRRVEISFPIENDTLKKHLLNDLNLLLQDNSKAWELQSNGKWIKTKIESGMQKVCAQSTKLLLN